MDHPYRKKKKIFKPIVLYNSNCSSTTINSTISSQNEQMLIEEHRLKTKNMLNYNAQIWKNEGRFFDTTSSSSRKKSSSDQSSSKHSSSPSFDLSDNVTSRRITHIQSSINHNRYIFHNDTRRRESLSRVMNVSSSLSMNILEPRTQTSIPLPLYSQELLPHPPDEASPPRPSSSHNNNMFVISKPEDDNDEEYFDGEEEETTFTNTTTFINEPRFHHTYKPDIARKRRRGNLPKQVTEFLKRWLILHKKHPYPTEREKQKLADETGLMVNQISNWFINARRRILQPLLESENRLLLLPGDKNASSYSAPPNPNSNLPSAGVNVVGGTSHCDSDNIHQNYTTDPAIEQEEGSNTNYQPHHHHHYNSNCNTDTSSSLLNQRTEDSRISKGKVEQEEEEGGGMRHRVPPPWVLLPAKLPSMNVLEKEPDAVEPEQ